MKAVMYHYVRPTVDRAPFGYYHLSLEDFRRQLDWFEREHGFVDKSTFVQCLGGKRTPPADGVVLTFDDGLADHYEWVLPELKSRGLWGLFFVPTGPLNNEYVLPVHRIHSLLGRNESTDLHDALREILSERGRSERENFGGVYADRDSEDALSSFKQLLNFEIPYREVDDVLDELESRFARTVNARRYYLSPEQLRALSDAGMLVGAHSVTHSVLSRLSPAEQRTEIVDSFDALADVLDGSPSDLFAYPYGTEGTFDEQTKRILTEGDCLAAFTTIPGDIDPDSLADSPLELPRWDCNEFPHGDATFDLS
jgi:peptidoglycan/xylan/chitin deacetylase (PgdA/CDA1 family)